MKNVLLGSKKYFLVVKNAAGYHPVPVIPFIQMEPHCLYQHVRHANTGSHCWIKDVKQYWARIYSFGAIDDYGMGFTQAILKQD